MGHLAWPSERLTRIHGVLRPRDDDFASPTNSDAPRAAHGPTLLAVVGVFLFLALACYAGRMYVRVRVLRYPWWDDLLISLASVSCCILRYQWG